jgi:hypothetical protein
MERMFSLSYRTSEYELIVNWILLLFTSFLENCSLSSIFYVSSPFYKDCHPGYTQHLLSPTLKDATCQSALTVATTASERSFSRRFVEVSFAQLLQPSAQAQLHSLRHPNIPPVIRLEPPAHAVAAAKAAAAATAAAAASTAQKVDGAATAITGSVGAADAGSDLEFDWWSRWRRWLFATVPLPARRSNEDVGAAATATATGDALPVLRVYALSDIHCDFKV